MSNAWGYFLMSLLLKVKGGWELFLVFLEKITSFACLLGSGLNCIFHWKTHLQNFPKSEFNYFADISIS